MQQSKNPKAVDNESNVKKIETHILLIYINQERKKNLPAGCCFCYESMRVPKRHDNSCFPEKRKTRNHKKK